MRAAFVPSRTAPVATAVRALVVVLVLGGRGALPACAANTAADAQRALTLLAAVGEEYREGVRDGAVVRPLEFEEAKAFLDDARQRCDSLPGTQEAQREIALLFAKAGEAMDAKAPADAVAGTLATLRERLIALTGVSEELYPPQAPAATRGEALFAEDCSACHGERGDGKGPAAAGLDPPPASFTDPQFMRAENPYDFYHVVTLGKLNTAMPAWDGVLSVQDRWDLVSYVWTLAAGTGRLAEGQGIYLSQCAGCHGANGDGRGTATANLTTGVPDLSRPAALARKSDADLFAITTHGGPAAAMPGFSGVLSEEERWKAVAFLRLLSLGGPASAAAETSGSAGSAPYETALRDTEALLDAAVAAYARGDRDAGSKAAEAYLQFEPLERRLGATDAALKTRIEEDFLRVRQLLRTPGNETQARAVTAGIHDDLAVVRRTLQPQSSRYALMFESATIILREGFEMVLVIGALIAYVVKIGSPAMQRAIYGGTAAGIVASLATAFVMGALLQLRPGSSDLLEGGTMLLAAGVLFWVSYWLISKAEADRWQRYIRGKVQTALTGGRVLALAGAAFLAVYREGFETVLFYQALYASAPGAAMTVTSGLLLGAAALLILYLSFRRFQIQIPLKQFFFVTGLLLYVMAAVFAGQGMHELQEAGWVGVTPVGGVPAVPVFGVYPALQPLALQAVLVCLFVVAAAVTLRQRARGLARQTDASVVVLEQIKTSAGQVHMQSQTYRERQP